MNYYIKFKKLFNKINELIDLNPTPDHPEFKGWHMECLRMLEKYYGDCSTEYSYFYNIDFGKPYDDDLWYDQNSERNKCKNGLILAKTILESFLEDMEDNVIITSEEQKTTNEEDIQTKSKEQKITNNNVFIVHGHNGALKYKTANLINKLGLNPIILHEQVNSSRTIIEKIEKYGSEAQAAIILFTPDDIGKTNLEKETKFRSRQNVVFEAGYFMGLLGRDKTILVVSDNSIDLPGDLSGVVYTGDSSEFEIAKELKAMGLKIDMNNLL